MDKNKYSEPSQAYGEMKNIINGSMVERTFVSVLFLEGRSDLPALSTIEKSGKSIVPPTDSPFIR